MTDNVTLPNLTWTTTNLSVPNLNTYVRDQLDAYFQAIAGDASVDTAIWQAVKSGTLSARSGVAHKVGRQYFATDTLQTFTSDGSNWRHTGGPGPFDDFVRTASATITPSKSGHTWAEVVGTWDIVAGGSPPANFLSLTSGTNGIATLDTGSLLDRPFQMHCGFITHSTQASINNRVFVKYVDANNHVYAELNATGFAVYKRVGGVGPTLVTGNAVSPSAGAYHAMSLRVMGQTVIVDLNHASAVIGSLQGRHDDLDAASLVSATKVGVGSSVATAAGTGYISLAVDF